MACSHFGTATVALLLSSLPVARVARDRGRQRTRVFSLAFQGFVASGVL